MKKKHLNNAKKTLSVFLAVLMLLSAWVFVPGEHNHASAAAATTPTGEYNLSLVNGLTALSTSVTTMTGSFAGDTEYTTQNYYDQLYKNVLRTEHVTLDSTPAAQWKPTKWKDSNPVDRIAFWHPTTVLLYDDSGVQPEFGVVLEVDAAKNIKIRSISAYIASGNNGLSWKNTYWKGHVSDRQDHTYLMNKGSDYLSTTGYEVSGKVFNTDSGAWWFLANSLKFTGTMNDTEYLRTITPTYGYIGLQATGDSNHTLTASSAHSIYVINYKPVKNAITKVNSWLQEIKNSPDMYTTASVKSFVDLYNKVAAAHPNKFASASVNNPTGYSSAASSAVNACNGFSLQKRTFDVTFENMFSISDWANSGSNASNLSSSQAELTTDVSTGTVRIWKDITGEAYTMYSGGKHGAQMYSMPVAGNGQYTISFNNTYSVSGGTAKAQVFFFWFDVNGDPVTSTTSSNTFDYADFTGEGAHSATFTAPQNARSVEVRFDNDCSTAGSTVYFKNIAVYPADRGTSYGIADWATRPVTKAYSYNATVTGTLDVPDRIGYDFNGWYIDANNSGTKDDGEAVTDAAGTVTRSLTENQHYNLYADWAPQTMDVGYDNLFSLSDWANSSGAVASNGTNIASIETDLENGEVTITTGPTSQYTEGYTAQSNVEGYYRIPVKASTEYVLKWDYDCPDSSSVLWVWYTNAYGANTTLKQDNAAAGSGTKTVSFTTPADAVYLTLRFNIFAFNTACTFSDIAIFEKSVYDNYAKDYAKVREPFKFGTNVSLIAPQRDGWVFDGWTLENGDKITNTANLTESTTVYANWTKLYTVTYYDGNDNVISTAKVKSGEPVGTLPTVTPTKESTDEYSYNFVKWTANGTDFTKDTVITSDIEVSSEFDPVPHTFVWQTNVDSFATCDAPAKVIKYCSGCGYSLGAVDYDGENANWLALGHAYTGGILSGSDTGNGTHLIKCARYSTCGKTIEEAHSWSGNTSEGATCTVPGKIKQSCPCGAVQTIDGALDETNHVNTTLINVEAPDCENDGYTGDTYCEDCKQTIATGNVDPKLGHSFTKYVSNGDATCTEDGTKTAKCDRCDATDEIKDEGSMLEHNWTDTEKYLKSEAECEKDEVYYKECSLCNASSEGITEATWTKTGTATGHDYTGDIRDNNNGTHSYLCKNGCSTYGFNKVEGASTACTYGDWDTTGADQHVKTCTACSYELKENHNFSSWASTDEDKKADGQHSKTCTVCSKIVTENCSYSREETKESCTTDGFTTHTCTVCDHEYVTAGTEATGHNYTGTVQSLGDGTHNYLCKNGCGTYGYETVEGNTKDCTYTYDNTEVGKHKATCTECPYSFTEPCSGGQATCTAAAVCDKCEEAYGTTVPHSFKGDAVKFEGDFHAYLCEFCGEDTDIYGVGTTENATEACSGGTATCSALAVCDICEDTHGDYDEDAHKWGAWVNVEGTETHKRVCEYNNDHVETATCESSGKAIVEADCETEGYDLNTCDFCNHQWRTNIVAPLDHDWGAWVNNEDGTHTRTCKREGCHYADDHTAKTETASCTKENAEAVVTEPKCTEGGYTTYTCKDCGYDWTDDATKATGHSFSEKKRKDNGEYKRTDKDCVTDETYWYCCDNCNVSAETEQSKYENIEDLYWVKTAAAGHSYTAETATEAYLKSAATCTAKAVYYKSCSVCGESSEGKGDKEATFTSGRALGHNWVQPEEDKLADYLATESDCITDATYYYVCSREGCGISSQGVKTDGETWTDTDSKSGHKFDYEGGHTAGTAADCENAGMTEHYTCEICGKHFTTAEATKEIAADKLVIKALGHDWEKVAKKAATCEEDGYTAHEQCKREGCGKKSGSYEVIDAKGHDFKPENGYYTDKGYHYHSYKCSNCDAYGVDGVKYSVDASGLDPEIVGGIPCDFTGEYVNYEDENGLHSHKLVCSCGNEQSAVCADAEPAYVAPTCTEDGYYSYTCDVCGYEWTVAGTEEKDQKLGHNLVTRSNGNGTHSTACDRDGCGYKETSQSCFTATPSTVCGSYDICDICKAAFGEAKAHVFTNYVSDNNATCTADGTKTALCDNCDDGTDTVTDKGSKLNHTMTEYGYSVDDWDYIPENFNETIEESTCCREGKSISYCTGCSLYLTRAEKKDPTKHNWEKDADSEDGLKWVAGAGDCTTGIVMTNKCTNVGCKEVQTKFEAVVDHDYVLIAESLPTCKLEGYRFYKCSLCGVEFFEEGEEATNDHKFEVIGETPATCTKNAYVTEQCKVCRDIRIVETEGTMLEHEYIDCKAVAPTCEADGHSAYLKCVDCGAVKDKITAAEDPSYAATGHSDADSDGKCDECYKLLYETEDGEKSCGCICHKESWIMRIIYKILNFFWKLFKISKTCNCGAVHW